MINPKKDLAAGATWCPHAMLLYVMSGYVVFCGPENTETRTRVQNYDNVMCFIILAQLDTWDVPNAFDPYPRNS